MASDLTDDDLSPIRRDYSADSDVMIIVFSGLKQRPGGVPGFSFQQVLGGVPARKLYVRDLRRAWYLRGLPGLSANVKETAAFFAREVQEQRIRRVVLTGYSLGGFAALLFGNLLGADEVHAFSPQTFISLSRRIWYRDHRWQRYVLKLHCSAACLEVCDLRPLLARPSRQTRKFVYYAKDSRLDKLHALRLAGLPGVEFRAFDEGSHRLVTALRDSGDLRRILEGAALRRPGGMMPPLE